MPGRWSIPWAGLWFRATVIPIVLFVGACDLVKPKDRQFNAQVQTPILGAIDASSLRPGQHLAGTLLLELGSLGAGGLSSPIVGAALYVDDSLYSTSLSGPPFVLRLDTQSGRQGAHQLSVFVYEADPNLGLGGLAGSPSQVLATNVVFDQAPPTAVTLTSVVWDNGAPRLTWTLNSNANFAAYQIVRDGNWGHHLPFPRPITDQSVVSAKDTLGLDALIGVQFTYHLDVDNRDSAASSNTLTLSLGDAVPGLRFAQGEPPPVPIPNSDEFYTYHPPSGDSLKVFSGTSQSLVRSIRPIGGSIAISRDGSTFILFSDVLLGGIPGLATYSATTLSEQSRIQMPVRLGGYSLAAGRADRVYAAGFEGLFVVRVSDAAVVGHIPLTPQPTRLAISPDVATLYAATRDSLYKIDISGDTPSVLAALRVTPDIADLQIAQDGQRLYLLHTLAAPSSFVQVLDATTLNTVGTLAPSGNEGLFAMHVTPNHLYLSHGRQDIPDRFFLAGSVVQYDRVSLARLRSWDFVQVPTGVFASADEQWFYASTSGATWVVGATAGGAPLAGR